MIGRLVTAALMVVAGAAHVRPRRRRRPASTCCSRSARARACCICCAGSGGASTRGPRLPRWPARSSSRVAFFIAGRQGAAIPAHMSLLVSIAITTVVWLAATWLTPPTDRDGARRVLPPRAARGAGVGADRGEGRCDGDGRHAWRVVAGVAVRVRGHLRRALRDRRVSVRAAGRGVLFGRRVGGRRDGGRAPAASGSARSDRTMTDPRRDPRARPRHAHAAGGAGRLSSTRRRQPPRPRG